MEVQNNEADWKMPVEKNGKYANKKIEKHVYYFYLINQTEVLRYPIYLFEWQSLAHLLYVKVDRYGSAVAAAPYHISFLSNHSRVQFSSAMLIPAHKTGCQAQRSAVVASQISTLI